MHRLLSICALLAIPGLLSAQTISGSWYGHAEVDVAGIHNNYLTELVIKQKGNRVEGIFGYYFRDKYQSFFIHGWYDPQTREITIPNIPVTFYGSTNTTNSVDCNTNFKGVLIRSHAGSSVKGALYSDAKYRYTCPSMKVSYILDKTDNQTDSTISAGLASARIWKPQADDLVIDAITAAPPVQNGTAPQNSTTPPTQNSTTPPARNSTALANGTPVKPTPTPDSTSVPTPAATSAAALAALPAPPNPELTDKKNIEESFTKRKPVISRVLDVESDSIRLSFYDNGEIDGDSISVFINNQVVLTHQELEARAFNLFLRLDSTKDVNEISMFAENLGRIPPNTALMVLTDGKNRYEVFLSSSLTQNATIQLKRRKPKSTAANQ